MAKNYCIETSSKLKAFVVYTRDLSLISNYCRCAPYTIPNLSFWDLFKKWKDIYLSDETNELTFHTLNEMLHFIAIP